MQLLSHHRLLLCLYLIARPDFAITASLHPKYLLMSNLTKNYPKDGKFIVPTRNLIVNVSISIYSVFGLDEKEVMEMNGWANVAWFDPRLTWDPADWFDLQSIYLSRSDIWVPDVGIINAKQWENKDFANSRDEEAEVQSSGCVSFFAYFLSKTPCPINTKAFPFDDQSCPVVLGTTHSKQSDFTIELVDASIPSFLAGANTVSQWHPTYVLVEGKTIPVKHRQSDVFQLVQLDVILERKPIYHIVLAIVPYCLICLVGSLIFVITSPGERFGLSLTILLAMSVYVMIVSQGAPKSMTTLSAMDNFLLVQMSLQVVFTFVMVLGPILNCANRYSNEKEEDRKRRYRRVTSRCWTAAQERMPRWNRKCDFGWLLVFLTASAVNGSVCLFVIPKST